MTPASAEVHATIDYLVPTSRINRRFWAPGKEYNTGSYAPQAVTIRNARLADPFTLAEHGFCLGHHHTDIIDWESNYGPATAYAAQVCVVARRLTGADLAVPMGGMIRTSGRTSATIQPPAAEAHVDFTQRSAERIAAAIYGKTHPDGPGYTRFIAFSLWRALSAPPQDMPLALCDAWRCPHTAFRDTTRSDAVERRSMEFRGIAYFSRS